MLPYQHRVACGVKNDVKNSLIMAEVLGILSGNEVSAEQRGNLKLNTMG